MNQKCCRICLKPGEYASIFNKRRGIQIPYLLRKLCSEIQIFESTELPTTICRSCLDMVDMVIDLIDISKKSEMKIKELQMVNPTNIKKEETEAFEDFYWDNDDLLSPTKEEDSISEKTTNLPAKAKTPDILNTSKRSIPETTTSQSAGYQCTTCGRILKNLSGLKQHELSHQNIQPYWCDYCPVKCKTKGCLLGHIKNIHFKIKKWKCEYCSKTFAGRNAFNVHINRMHTKAIWYPCSLCEKTFTSKGSLKIHTRVHTGERPFSCKFCTNSYIHSTDLKRHTMMHTGERPYKCLLCSRGFTKKSNLTIHSRTHLR